MEKLPEKDKGGSASLSQSVTSTSHTAPTTSVGAAVAATANKPSTSAAALVANSLKQTLSSSLATAGVTETSKVIPSTSTASAGAATTSASSMIVRQESVLSKQGSISSSASPGPLQRNISPSPSNSSSAALLDNQHNKPVPAQQHPSVSSESGAGGTGGEVSSSTTSLSKDSVIHASPSISIQSATSKVGESGGGIWTGNCTITDGAVASTSTSLSRKVSIPNEIGGGVSSSGSLEARNIVPIPLGSSPPSSRKPISPTNPSTSASSSSMSGHYRPGTGNSSSTTAADADNKNNQQPGQNGSSDSTKEVCPWDHE